MGIEPNKIAIGKQETLDTNIADDASIIGHPGVPVEKRDNEKSEEHKLADFKNKPVTFSHPGKSRSNRFEDSIRTPYPDEYTPALTFLRDANKLGKEGAPKEQIDEAIELARLADSDATSLYLTCWEIIKRRNLGT